MKKILTLVLSLSFILLQAQVMNRSVEDCNNTVNSIYAELSTGKALIVASDGFDCSICRSKASAWGTWASNNSQQVSVWGAMTNTYSANTPDCTMLNNWVSTYSWNDIYTFIDSSQYFFEFGTPRYSVYSPVDSSLIYQGSNEGQARNLALNASQSGLSLRQNRSLETISFYIKSSVMHFSAVPEGNILVEVYNLTGQKEKTQKVSKDNAVLPLNDLAKGIYLMRLSRRGQTITRKIVLS